MKKRCEREGREEIDVYIRQIPILILVILLFCPLFIFSSSCTASSFDYSLQIHNETVSLIPGSDSTLALFINQSGNETGTVTLQGAWTGAEPEGITASIQPSTGTVPFQSTVAIRSLITTTPGSYTLRIYGSSEGTTHTLDIHINVTTNVKVSLHTDKASYLKGQTIHLFGNATTTDGSHLTSGSVVFTIVTEQRSAFAITSLQNSSFEYFYPISYGDYEGQWTIQARVIGNTSQVGIQTSNITVSLPLGAMRYTVDFYAPPNNAIFERGDRFPISVYVTENSRAVQNATTRCRLPSMQTISLLEYSPGNYKQNYTIPWDAPLGDWFFTVESIKNVSGTVKAGGSCSSITIQPAPLKVMVVQPSSLQVSSPSTIHIEIRVQYPDATNMSTGEVTAIMPRGDITLERMSNGLFATNISFTDQDVGTQIIEFHAKDLYGNIGFIKKIAVIVSVPQTSIFLSFIPLFAASACCVIGVFFTRRFYKGQHLRTIQEEMKATQRLKEETGRKYYVDGSISKEVYDALMYEHVQRYSQLQKDERKILNK